MALAIVNEEEPEPVPMTRGELIEFALANGYTKNRASYAWQALQSGEHYRPEATNIPAIRFIRRRGERSRPFDLRSVYERLKSTDPNSLLGSLNVEAFLIHVVNERLQPVEPLTIEARERL